MSRRKRARRHKQNEAKNHATKAPLDDPIKRCQKQGKGTRTKPRTLLQLSRKRERQLENPIIELTERLHDQRVHFLVDLRIAIGVIHESEREKSQADTSKLSEEVLDLIKGDLIKILAHRNTISSAPKESSTRTPGGQYVT